MSVAFLARRVGGTIEAIERDGRTLVVVTDDGEAIRFELSPATGSFVQEGPTGGAKLAFEDEPALVVGAVGVVHCPAYCR